MGTKKMAGTVLLLGGIVLLVLSLIADSIKIGGAPGIGLYQIAAAIAGAIIAGAGLVLISRK